MKRKERRTNFLEASWDNGGSADGAVDSEVPPDDESLSYIIGTCGLWVVIEVLYVGIGSSSHHSHHAVRRQSELANLF